MTPFGSRPVSEVLEAAEPDESREVPIDREELVVLRAPASRLAEQYRRMRNSLQALNPDGAARSILMTSAVEGEGKTISTLNLALSLAEVPSLRVVAVDGNLTRPGMEAYLGLPRRKGLAELLEGSLNLSQAIRATSIGGFDVVGAGASSTTAPGLDLERLQAILNALKRRYDYVLVDGPAVLSTNHPSLMGSIVDGILLVVRIGSTPKGVVEEAYRLLEGLGGNVLGTCATAVDDLG
jgi:capsular exopolysaccharide synthesis family protein